MNALDLLEALPVMLWTARADGVWTHVNTRWTTYTGIQGSAPGFGFEAALHPDDVVSTVARWTEAVKSETPYRAEYRLRRGDGLYRWHITRGVLAPLPDDDVVWIGACTDIHDQKLAEHETLVVREAAVRALGLALEARDHETKGHTDRVTTLAIQLGKVAGLHDETLHILRLGAYLHDIGKIAVPDAILLKPGLLTHEERLEMQQHVVSGERFASSLGFLGEDVLEVIRGHHERWDGSGYPAGLGSSDIPLLARIFALADVYDALVSKRPYKSAWTDEQARTEIAAQAGHQFDPQLTTLFLGAVESLNSSVDSQGRTTASQGGAVNSQAGITVPARVSHENLTPFAVLSEQVRSLALNEAAISVLITDADQRLLYVNTAFSVMTGYEPAEVLGRNPRFLQGKNTDPEDRRALREALAAGQQIHQRILNYSRSGEELWFDMHVAPIFVEGKLSYFVAVQNDSSVQVSDHRKLHWSANHDALTGLLNRSSLNQALSGLVVTSALIFIDLDNLKGINDQHGHLTGDRALQGVAKILKAHTPVGGRAFRLGGDEFLVLLPIQHEVQAARCVRRLRRALADIQAGEDSLVGSFGISFFPREGRDLWLLMGLADERMYLEKLGHTNRRASAVRRNQPESGL